MCIVNTMTTWGSSRRGSKSRPFLHVRCQHEGDVSFVPLCGVRCLQRVGSLRQEGDSPDRTSPSSSLPPLPHPPAVIPMPITSFPPLLTSCILLPSFLHPLTSFLRPLRSFLHPLTSFPPLLTSFPRRRESNPLRPTRIHTPPRKGGRGQGACCHAKRISRQMDYPHSAWLCYNWNSHDSSGTLLYEETMW